MNIRAEFKMILEAEYGTRARAQTLNKLLMVVSEAIIHARKHAQDEQARAFFGSIIDNDVGDGG